MEGSKSQVPEVQTCLTRSGENSHNLKHMKEELDEINDFLQELRTEMENRLDTKYEEFLDDLRKPSFISRLMAYVKK